MMITKLSLTGCCLLYFAFKNYGIKVSAEFIQDIFKVLPSQHVKKADITLTARSIFDCADVCLKSDTCTATTYNNDDKQCFLSNESPPDLVDNTEDTVITLLISSMIGELAFKSHFGTSFMTGFMCISECDDNEGILQLFIVSTVLGMTNVSVTIPSLEIYEEKHALNGFLHLNYTSSLMPPRANDVSFLGIEVITDQPVSLYLINSGNYSTDGTLELPTKALGNFYIVNAYNSSAYSYGQILVIAVFNNTEIIFDLPSGYTETLVLDKFETYEFHANSSVRFSGTFVAANNSVAVHAGHGCVNIQDDTVAHCDHILASIPPVNSLGHVFIMSYPYPMTNFSFGIAVPYDGTVITVSDINGTELEEISLNRQDTIYRSMFSSTSISLTSNENILVTQYGHAGTGVSDDSSVTIIPAVKQFVSRCTFVIPPLFNNQAIVSVTISAANDLAELHLNGAPVAITESTSVLVPNEGVFNVVYIEVVSDITYVLYHVDQTAKFGAVLFARSQFGEFSTVLGLSF